MLKNIFYLALLFVSLSLFFSQPAPTFATEQQQPLSFTGPNFQIEELAAQLHSDDSIIAVTGKVRNLSHRPVTGHVVVYFLNATGAVVFATESEVKPNSPFAHGDTASFETSVNIKYTPGTNNVSVEFVADNL